MRRRAGYAGWVRLVAPDDAQSADVWLPRRERLWRGLKPQMGTVVKPVVSPKDRALCQRETRRFHRLLSAGWTVATANTTAPPEPEPDTESATPVQKPPEHVDEVAEQTSATSNDTHGGNEATGDIADSPNAADDGNNSNRESTATEPAEQTSAPPQPTQRARGGRARTRKHQISTEPETALVRDNPAGASVYAPAPIQATQATHAAAAESARLLADLVGTHSAHTTVQGTQVDPQGLLLALETGADPVPALEAPRERPRMRVVVTPDCSGSTQDWSGLGQAWALTLAEHQDLDVVYVENFNGQFCDARGGRLDAEPLLAGVDMVVYLGDQDGEDLCREYAATGTHVLLIDSYAASRQAPMLRERSHTKAGGTLTWVNQTSAKTPATWTAALRLAL